MKKSSSIFLLLFCTQYLLSQQEENLIKFEGETQGTTYHITYIDSLRRNLQDEVNKLLMEFDQSVSTYNPHSVISKINANVPGVLPDKYFTVCFNKAKEVWKSTNGAFDPTVYPLVNAWGFGPGKKQKIEKARIDSILEFVGFNLIKIKNGKVIKKDKRVALDFNAFAQGYSVDVVAEFLMNKGIKSLIVEIGGEVFAKGRDLEGKPWLIGVEQPIDNKESMNPLMSMIKLENKAASTSGNYRRYIIENGIKYAHHLDPKTGYPAKNNLLSATLVAHDCITTDANATGVLVMGLEKAKLFFQQHSELEACLIYSDEKGNFQVYETPGFKMLKVEMQE